MPEYRTLNNIAYEHLRNMIYQSKLEFGRVYSETKLATQLNISRTPIRDALNRLAQERYIDILPNRGFMLHSPTQADILEAYHVRLMIEGYCAGIVAAHYPEAAARATVARMEDALLSQQHILGGTDYDLGSFWLDDLRFHLSLLEYMSIPSLYVQYESFMHVFRPQNLLKKGEDVRHSPRAIERHRSTLTEHAEIVDALKSRDKDRVSRSIRAHIDSSLRVLFLKLEE